MLSGALDERLEGTLPHVPQCFAATKEIEGERLAGGRLEHKVLDGRIQDEGEAVANQEHDGEDGSKQCSKNAICYFLALSD